MKKIIAAVVVPALFCLTAGQAHALDNHVTLGALGGTTGVGAELSWRFHKRLGVTAQYASGLDWDGEFDTDEVNYEGDIGISAGALKVDYYPFAGGFYLTAGAMLPDMEANVQGTAKERQDVELNGNPYTTDEIGSLEGKLTIADGVRPYAGIGWRSSHRSGFGVFSEIGVMATNVDVSLSSSNNLEAEFDQLRADLRQEEQELKDEAEKLPFYPVAVLGISYTF
jgi:hypothetical protein